MLDAARRAAALYKHGRVVEGTITTCDSWNCEVDRITFLHESYGSLAEEMEGDAVAQVCQSFDVPFLDVRIISTITSLMDEIGSAHILPVCSQQ